MVTNRLREGIVYLASGGDVTDSGACRDARSCQPCWVRRLWRSAALAGLAFGVQATGGCTETGLEYQSLLEGIEAAFADADPVSTFDGSWADEDHGFALAITNRTGVLTQSNSSQRKVGDAVLAIVSVNDSGFTGRWMFQDGLIYNVSATWTGPDSLAMAGGGWQWNLVRAASQTAPFTLTVNVTGEGTVTADKETFNAGDALTLKPVPADGWRFDHWEGDLTGGRFDHWRDVTVAPVDPARLTMDSDKEVTAVFVERRVDPVTFDFGDNTTMRILRIEGGTFTMGSSDAEQTAFAQPGILLSREGPQHAVTVSAFAMSETEVTQAQFYAVMGYIPAVPEDCTSDCFETSTGATLPAAWVSWTEAVAFCDALATLSGRSCRLPTEAEWEYACRAGTTTAFHFGDTDDDLDDYAWWRGTSYEAIAGTYRMQVVASKLPNAWGLYDMHGNVWEWVGNWYEAYSGDSQVDPVGGAANAGTYSRGVLRGGAFQREPWALRSAYRFEQGRAAQFNFGFRIVCE